ncbi:MAG: hypothetical protein WB791_00855 [Waddliaceae bacterium]
MRIQNRMKKWHAFLPNRSFIVAKIVDHEYYLEKVKNNVLMGFTSNT